MARKSDKIEEILYPTVKEGSFKEKRKSILLESLGTDFGLGEAIITESEEEEYISPRKRFLMNNYVIVNGNSYSKKYVRDMKTYFNHLDIEGKGYLTIDEYVNRTNKIGPLRSISISLFNYLDKNGQGTIRFRDLVMAMIPGATVE